MGCSRRTSLMHASRYSNSGLVRTVLLERIASEGISTGRLLINVSFTSGFLNISRKKHAMVPEVVSDPANSISAIWSTTSLVPIFTPLSGFWPLSSRCWRRSGRTISWLVFLLTATAEMACFFIVSCSYILAVMVCFDVQKSFLAASQIGHLYRSPGRDALYRRTSA